jgi:hypothetical protein
MVPAVTNKRPNDHLDIRMKIPVGAGSGVGNKEVPPTGSNIRGRLPGYRVSIVHRAKLQQILCSMVITLGQPPSISRRSTCSPDLVLLLDNHNIVRRQTS